VFADAVAMVLGRDTAFFRKRAFSFGLVLS
jgi:hypothetical protein